MAYVPPPVGVNVGGYVVIKYTNGTNTHRVRFHVAPFDSGTGTYATPTGTETKVGDTVADIISVLEPFYLPGWTFSWEKLYHYAAGIPVEVPLTQVVIPAVGSGAGVEAAFSYIFTAWNFRSSLLGRGRFFLIGGANQGLDHPHIFTPTYAAPFGPLVTYFSGAGTQVVAHDGGKFLAPVRVTTGVNRKLRRKFGDA